ncbi:hypothetical protein J5X98_16595 [Leptothermofonsia sichuanensis E412]|uniref:hypothetical protein n=1 Tax=Leptothermofonsia sichuanensis TaxID=2917832 RepID=UPI001CA765E6|nr:hypothetical protein [Leptothermofonsia sichuanensis]QZZ19035.1 hypothetical protein J5X98_16595 [Leptothermofonsia sichuanensis E412]
MAVSMGPDEQGSLVAELAGTPLAERIESLKAGVVGAGAAGLVFGMASLGKIGLLAFPVVAGSTRLRRGTGWSGGES